MKLYVVFLLIWIRYCVSESSHYRVCGYRPLVEDSRGSRVVGGKDAELGNWPWIVSIQAYNGSEHYHICGGVVLDKLWVLTAAHCFEDVGDKYFSWRLVFGANQLSDLGMKAQIRTIIEKVQHDKYDPETARNDIALLKLNESIVYDEYTLPACLPAKQAIPSKMDDCYIAGWGAVKEGSANASDILQEAPVNLIPLDRCNRPTWYNGTVGDYNLCAGYEEGDIDSCQGDSGGPLMCKKGKSKFYFVVGITSWGSGCGQKTSPGVYTSTQYHLQWINEHVFGTNKPEARNMENQDAEKSIWQKLAELIRKAGKKLGLF